MTDLLRPLPEHDLPPDRAADIRRIVLRSAGERRRRPGRRAWFLVPVVSMLVVVGAVLGLRAAQAPSVLGSPSPAPLVTSSTSPGDGAIDTDAGPVSHADALAVVDRLNIHGPGQGRPAVAEIVVARRITTALGDGTFVMWTDAAGSTWWGAEIPGVSGSWGPISGPAAKKAVPVPDAVHPVVRLTDLRSFGWRTDADRPDATARDLHSENFYRVAPSVDRVEVRMTVKGKHTPWFTAPVFDGYTYLPAVVPGAHSTTENVDAKVEDRAFDHDGNRVPIVAS